MLTALKPTIAKLSPLIAQSPTEEADRSRFRDKTQHWRKWYHTGSWRTLRWGVLKRDKFTCQLCGSGPHHDTSQLVCDHVHRHNGNEQAFWAGPFQTLCKGCHDSKKQSSEAHGPVRFGKDRPALFEPPFDVQAGPI